jgi:tetratricopeptide (TPR) repeat protein
MSIKVAKNRFIVSSLQAGFYQQTFRDISGFHELGCKLVKEAEIAQAFRQDNRVVEIASILCHFPIKEHRLIGQYYKAWLALRTRQNARSIFERVAQESRTYKAKALMSLAATEAYLGNFDAELGYFTEAKKATDNTSLIVEISRSIAVVRAKEGDHRKAIKDFEKMFPLVRHAAPNFYYQYLNSLAVELGEVGRKYEARNICHHVLASPFAIAYPEWRETAEELKGSNRSFAVLNPTRQRSGKILSMPVIEYGEPVEQHKPAPVISLETWKAKMGKNREGLDSRQLLLRLMELGTAPGMTDGKLLQVIQLMERLLTEPQKPDDESGV